MDTSLGSVEVSRYSLTCRFFLKSLSLSLSLENVSECSCASYAQLSDGAFGVREAFGDGVHVAERVLRRVGLVAGRRRESATLARVVPTYQ